MKKVFHNVISKGIKVFIVEDTPSGQEILSRAIREDEKWGLEYVGSASENLRDLPDLLKKSEADVVLVDIILGTGIRPENIVTDPEKSGVEAIKSIRTSIGQNIKILGFSLWPQFKQKALDAGANDYLLREATLDEIREAIYLVYTGRSMNPHSFWIGKITGLELFYENQEILVIGDRGRTERIPIPPTPFVFLLYLSEERLKNGEKWIFKEGQGKVYKIKYSQLWSNICSDIVSINFREDLYSNDLAKWCNLINEKIKPYLDRGEKNLVTVPGAGRKKKGSYYSLNNDIASDNIKIHRSIYHGV